MGKSYRILILGASYGSLLGTKLALAGSDVDLVCLPAEVELINREGAVIRTPVRGRNGLVEIRSQGLPGKLAALGPADADPTQYDLVALAMQEPQYGSPGVRELLARVAKAKVPCMSIMNMPPLTYLKRLPNVDVATCRASYTDPSVWDDFAPDLMTLCSPDPQAFRPPQEQVNVLQVRLPTNFKAARFGSDTNTRILRDLETAIMAVRFEIGREKIELPVKLHVHDSVFVPLAKWCMLIAGNYRCATKKGMRSIREAVHTDLAASRVVYEWVAELCVKLGAAPGDMVPFDKYANAALSLVTPSSAARALYGGAPNIERVDLLVQTIAAQQGMRSDVLDEVVHLIDEQISVNRKTKTA